MQPARASAVAAVVFASVGLLGGAAALTYAGHDTSQGASTAAAHGHHQDKHEGTQQDKQDKQDKADRRGGDDASAAGRAHADAMKAWARCVAAAASGPKAADASTPPKTACGDKPTPPGRAKHAADSGGPGTSGHHQRPKTHGHSGAHHS
jgi:hypothetical protein